MAVEWSPVAAAAIGVAGTVLGAWIGYLTARQHSKVERARMASERERLFFDYVEQRLKQRRAVYHDALETMYRFHHHRSGVLGFSEEQRRDWLRDLNRCVTAVSLSGTEEAYRKADDLAWIIHDSLLSPEQPWDIDAFNKKWAEALHVMRVDIARLENERPGSS